ncbi:MAG: biotin/lipoyl-binding protein [Elusimicrobia bacterium]|nr:biotin/lipoyl-binding protein [Elusimicrobiota bacterium]
MIVEDRFEAVIRWARTTDLAEVSYRRGESGVDFRIEGAPPAPPPMPACALTPARSSTVGIYRAAALGLSGRLEEGRQVREGEPLGQIEAGGRTEPVKAPSSGKLVAVLIEDGKPVEYGQTLFFVQS